MSTFIHLMRGQMSKPLDELGGKCPYMPFLDRGQMSEGEHVRPPSKPHAYLQSMVTISVKFQENRNKTVGGVAHTRYPLSIHFIKN